MISFVIAFAAALIAAEHGQGPIEPSQPEVEENAVETTKRQPLYTFTLPSAKDAATYDLVLAAAVLQGVVNREEPALYCLSEGAERPRYWLDVLGDGGRWLSGREQRSIEDLDALVRLAGDRLKGAVIWDPDVPATVNVATTIAGVKDAVVLSPDMADTYVEKWGLPILDDLRGKFDGSETGSAKNDAYRWAVREYIDKGLCSSHLLCLFEDAHSTRAGGNVGYVVTRDWAVKNRAFVFDLSPWGDEKPGDDDTQPMGLDKATYEQVLAATMKQAAGKHMTELAGFFAFQKYSNVAGHASAHDPVPTEWESVHLMSPYNCYQNTVASDCYNQSLHSQAPFKPLKQGRPQLKTMLEPKAYVCILMADYDSATPLYDFMPRHWDDPKRGQIPLCWGINPNLIETFPDIITYLYDTATPNDHFASDASAAGYMNPNRIAAEHLPLFIKHNKRFFDLTDMTMAPMVLDWDEPSSAVKDAFAQFAPDGFATIVMDLHNTGGKNPDPHVWKGMPVTVLLNNTCNHHSTETTARIMFDTMKNRAPETPSFYFFRIVWVGPSTIVDVVNTLRKEHPGLDFEVLDPYSFFALLEKHLKG